MRTNEAERAFYLAMIGVQPWYSRQPLPGAAASPEFVFPLEVPALTEATSVRSSGMPDLSDGLHNVKSQRQKGPAAAGIADLQSLMSAGKNEPARSGLRPPRNQQTSASVGPGADQTPDPVLQVPSVARPEAHESAQGEQVLKMALAVWQGHNVSLVAALSSDASARLQQTLAHNILQSLGETELDEGTTVHWPVFNNLLVPGNQSQDLVAVLKPILSGLTSQRVIVLGVDAGHEEGAIHAGASVPFWLSEALPVLKQPPMAVGFSLAELAAQPHYKRALWRVIKDWVS